jgi:predicted NAD/FAD-binding protein
MHANLQRNFIESVAGRASIMAETSRQEQNLRVAIIGGGISGLTAAQQLASLGYDDVVIFEEDTDVGGKIKTFEYEERPYELGALIFNHECPNVLQLAYRYGQPYFAAGKPLLIEQDGTVLTYQELIKQRYGYLSFLAAAYRMLYGRISHPHERDLGFANQDPCLFRPMEEFADVHHIEAATDCIDSFLTGCGYGYYEDIPALYLMKLAPVILKELIASGLSIGEHQGWSIFQNGWQEICRQMAGDLVVRLSSPVTQIRRAGANDVEITANGVTERFGRVILAMPLDEALKFLDATPLEQDLFQRIRYHRYLVTLVEGEGLFTASFKAHVTIDSIGHINFIVQPYADRPVFQLYQLLGQNLKVADALTLAQQDIAKINGKITKIITQKEWRYFPHVTMQDLSHGYYDLLESMQGNNDTYYIGAILSFETVEQTAAYAKDLITRNFGRVRLRATDLAPQRYAGDGKYNQARSEQLRSIERRI